MIGMQSELMAPDTVLPISHIATVSASMIVKKTACDTWDQFLLQWNLSVTNTSIIKFIACDLFSNVF